MNRKDTIIIAVLINAGLLALLFMMAINTDEEVITSQPALNSTLVDNAPVPILSPAPLSSPQPQPQIQIIPPPVNILADAGSADEMDNFLKDLSSSHLAQSPFIDDEGLTDLDSDLVHTIPPEKNEEANASDTKIVEVTVKRGDALEKIARSNGTTVEVIKKINKLTSSKLNIGQVLRVPVPVAANHSNRTTAAVSSNGGNKSSTVAATSSTTPSKAQEVKAAGASEPEYYTIKSGDNPWKIAKEHKVKYDDILKWNGMDEEKARNLKVGDKIRVK